VQYLHNDEVLNRKEDEVLNQVDEVDGYRSVLHRLNEAIDLEVVADHRDQRQGDHDAEREVE